MARKDKALDAAADAIVVWNQTRQSYGEDSPQAKGARAAVDSSFRTAKSAGARPGDVDKHLRNRG